MIAFIKGRAAYISPTQVIIETAAGVGYEVQISLYTFQKIKDEENIRILTHLSIKEDSHTLFGFFDEEERSLFRNLISVNGVGPSTARMILSSLNPGDLNHAIITGDITLLKAVKGIGPKTAQRLVLELQDKVKKAEGADIDLTLGAAPSSAARQEAVSALLMLGFNRANVEKVVKKVMDDSKGEMVVEQIIKIALKNL
jgi:holliday junction DNA helicase RuvA